MPASFPKPSKAVQKARARRSARDTANQAKVEWYADQVLSKINLTMKQRVQIAGEYVKNKVVKNISIPVIKGTGPRGGRVVTGRSKPGEFPRADTTQLMKTIGLEVKQESDGVWAAYIYTPLDYGLILETRMSRSFLRRTLKEERARVVKILTGSIV